MSGNLSFQIEHHLFPDIPARRYQQIAPQVREICQRYGIPYNTGRLSRQFGSVIVKIFRFALPGPHQGEDDDPHSLAARGAEPSSWRPDRNDRLAAVTSVAVCLLVVAFRVVPGTPLLIGANRDEFLSRPAVAMTVLQSGRSTRARGTGRAIRGHLARRQRTRPSSPASPTSRGPRAGTLRAVLGASFPWR